MIFEMDRLPTRKEGTKMPAQYDLVETVGLCPNHEFNGIVGVLAGWAGPNGAEQSVAIVVASQPLSMWRKAVIIPTAHLQSMEA